MSEQPTTTIQLLTTHDVAAILGWSLRRVQRLFNSGAFATVRVGRVIRVRREVFERWTHGQVHVSAAPASAKNVPDLEAADVIAIHQYAGRKRGALAASSGKHAGRRRQA